MLVSKMVKPYVYPVWWARVEFVPSVEEDESEVHEDEIYEGGVVNESRLPSSLSLSDCLRIMRTAGRDIQREDVWVGECEA